MDHAGNGLPPLIPTADLHLHSTASDGDLTPTDVVRKAHRVDLTAIALTDHDTMAGLPEARAAAAPLGLRVVTGCEFSVLADWGELHLLGYHLTEDDPAVLAFLTQAKDARLNRAREIVERVGRCGIDLRFEQVAAAASGAPIGRPHVAKALMAAGVTRSLDEGFDRLLGRGRPAYVTKALPSVELAATLIRASGGVSVVAHPKTRGTREALDRLRAQGVDGVEVRHPSHTPTIESQLMEAATGLDMLVTGGSDAHGDGAASPSHREIGGVRVPLGWLEAVDRLAASRRPDVPR